MNRGLKIALIVGGSLAVAGGATFFILKARRKQKEKKLDEKLALENQQALEQVSAGFETTQSGTTQSGSSDGSVNCSPIYTEPKRNLDKDIINPLSEIKGKTIYPAQKSNDPFKGHNFASGYANIRNSAEANNKNGTFDYSNKIGKITSGNKIGTIVSETYDNHSPKHRWFKVKLAKKMEDCSGWTGGLFGCDEVTYGWVRADNVTFPKGSKKYSFECSLKEMCAGKTSATSDKVDIWRYGAFKIQSDSKKNELCKNFGGYKGGSSFTGEEVVFDGRDFIIETEVFSGIGGQEFDVSDVLTDLD